MRRSTIAPGARAHDSDRHRDRAAARHRRPGAAALRARRAPRRHGAQHARHDRCRLPRRNTGDSCQSRRANRLRSTRGMRIAQLVIAPVLHAQLVGGAKTWTKPRVEPEASARPAKERLTRSGKAGRNIIPLYDIMDTGSPHGAALPQGSPRHRCRHRRRAPWPGPAGVGQGPGRRHELPARHLEPVLQALVRMGILKGIRGPRGGYELARERRRITADDILRAAGTIEDASDRPPRPARRCSTRW